MMTHFGMQQSPASRRRTIRIQIAALGSFVLATGAILTLLLFSTRSTASQPPHAAAQSEVEAKVSLLVPHVRIELATKLLPEMFGTVEMPVDFAPAGLVASSELSSIVGSYATRLLVPNKPFSHQDLSPHAPLAAIQIPAGHRAITIKADARTLIDGFVRPRSRVDVLWHYVNPRQQEKVRTLVPFTKVLAVNGSTDPASAVTAGEENTATLLVSREDASRLELAQRRGSLSLALHGNDGGIVEEKVSEVGLRDLYDETDFPQQRYNGRFITTSASNGNLIEWQLIDEQWVRVN